MKEKIVKILTSKQFAAFCTALVALVVYLLTMTSCSTLAKTSVRGSREVEKNVKSTIEYVYPGTAKVQYPKPNSACVSSVSVERSHTVRCAN